MLLWMDVRNVLGCIVVAGAALVACSSSSSSGGSSSGDAGAAVTCPDGTQDCNPAVVTEGKGIVQMQNCPGCHTADMGGSTTIVPDPVTTDTPGTVFLYPPNLTPDMMTGIGSWTDAEIARAVRDGFDDHDQQLCTQMKHFTNLTLDQGLAVAAYLRSLPPVSRVIPSSICPPLKLFPDGGL
jgi:Cytochrome c